MWELHRGAGSHTCCGLVTLSWHGLRWVFPSYRVCIERVTGEKETRGVFVVPGKLFGWAGAHRLPIACIPRVQPLGFPNGVPASWSQGSKPENPPTRRPGKTPMRSSAVGCSTRKNRDANPEPHGRGLTRILSGAMCRQYSGASTEKLADVGSQKFLLGQNGEPQHLARTLRFRADLAITHTRLEPLRFGVHHRKSLLDSTW
jgi:hypothetical protein